MYEISVRSCFSSAHQLKFYRGKCENLHGHNWEVEVVFSTSHLNSSGMVVDFKIAKEILNKVIAKLDHKFLNELPYFQNKNPTSENLAYYIYDEIKKQIKDQGVEVVKVIVWESPNTGASYIP